MLNEEDVRAIARDEFRKLLTEGIGKIDSNSSEFLPTVEAWKPLGYRNPKQLLNAIDNGLFRVNIEVQDRRGHNSKKAKYYFNIEACRKRLKTPAEKRKS